MAVIGNLKVGQKIEIETDEGKSFKGQLKKVKDRLIAVSVTSGLSDRSSLGAGSAVQVNINGTRKDLVPAVIKQDKAFPLIILSLKPSQGKLSKDEQMLEAEDIEDMISSITDPSYVKLRDSARTEDTFSIEFYKQSPERAALKKNEYLIRPTHMRRESAREAPVSSPSGVNMAELRGKISHLDPVLQGIIVDLYGRVGGGSAAASSSDKSSDEAIGLCVDISGTGLRFMSSQKLKRGDILKVMISPPLANPSFSISALVEVKRVSKVSNPKPANKGFAIGVKYYAMNEEDMEMITGYTFKLQRDQLQLKRQLKAS